MRRWKTWAAAVLVGALVLTGLLAVPQQEPGAAAAGTAVQSEEEFRGMWVASVYNLDYPSKATTSPAALKAEADKILQGCLDMGMTAVILQVRPSCDALYPSEIFPWSRYLTGTAGTAPSGGFDPLAYWVERAHALGLELHAWINPYRVTKEGAAELAALPASHPAVAHPEWVVEYEGNYYLDPGLPEVRELVIRGAEELVRNYDVDGIHLDDYFYPGSGFGDDATFAKYGKGWRSRDDWRRENVNLLVKKLGERIHAIDPDVSYGISPSGVWADKKNQPAGSATTGGYESYYASYADSRKWVKEGWLDYICPQIYWYIGHKTMDYATIARWWAQTVEGTGVKLYIGMADYQAGKTSPSDPWYGTKAIEAQLALNDTLPQVAGEVHFRYQLIAANSALVNLYREAYAAQPEPEPTPTPTPTSALDAKLYLSQEDVAYVEGSGGLFRPEDSLSRAEAVTLLSRLSVDEKGKSLFTGEAGATPFRDVAQSAWYAPYVYFAWNYGVANGYPGGTFRPEDPVTRAELVKLLATYFEPEAAAQSPFPDVTEDYWAVSYIAFGVSEGWLSGYPDGTFRPEEPVTRAEAVKIINRALNRSADVEEGAEMPFADVPADYWAYGEILAAAV